MSDVKLTASEAREIAAQIDEGINQMRTASTNLVRITTDLSTNGMKGLAGPALAGAQERLHARAENLANISLERSQGLKDYANVVEAGQAEDAHRASSVG
ncbi:hypothetical protein [Rhodococcus pyridinivorans]|uniref:hypothetical protein n=1 Tax=Rhodococcus pyridinivorans TaxID=103816 RepID=UPI002657BA8F|nr:hypothetical protein [Rhodococcus pyridinivorans]